MDVIYAGTDGVEIGFLTNFDLDLEVGGSNDFEVSFNVDKKQLDFGYSIYADGTEYGGIISKLDIDTASNRIAYSGQTWRGILSNYIIAPATGEDYKIVSGNVSTIISGLISDFGIDGRYSVETVQNVTVSNYRFDRYCTLLDGIVKMLKSVNYRLNISCTTGAVTLTPTSITDYSEELEYSQDSNINFRIKDDRNGVNHLVCLGQGDLSERQVIDLYLQSDGSIGYTQYYFGLNEHAEVYDYSSVESLEDLDSYGRERFSELLDKQTLKMSIDEINVELGDIVGGRDRVTDIYMTAPITRKILQATDYDLKISYEVG